MIPIIIKPLQVELSSLLSKFSSTLRSIVISNRKQVPLLNQDMELDNFFGEMVDDQSTA